MIIVDTKSDIKNIKNTFIRNYVYKLFNVVISENNITNGSIDSVGDIYIIEHSKDFADYKSFGLSRPISEDRFEYVDDLKNNYYNAYILINNECIINIIFHKDDYLEYFGKVDFI